jgi:formiminotetrahydrofolate cyclodeaminase
VSLSLWVSTAEQLLQRTSSADPTPGGGAIAAVTAAFGAGLVHMAIEVTVSRPQGSASESPPLAAGLRRAGELQARMVEAADADVSEFDALMAAYRLPRDSDEQRLARQGAIDEATVTATHGPLGLAELAMAAVALGREVEPLVKPTIVSDVHAGCDLLRGAALAALRTADINLAALEQRGHPEAPALRERRDALGRVVTSAQEHV